MWLLIFFGIIFLLLGTLLLILGSIQTIEKHRIEGNDKHPPPDQTRIKGGGVILIGPIPIIVGSDYRYAAIAIILAIILMLIIILWGMNFQ